ncbi:MAG: hypothetical protein AAFO62_08505 [Pseudomonadota bacterium]
MQAVVCDCPGNACCDPGGFRAFGLAGPVGFVDGNPRAMDGARLFEGPKAAGDRRRHAVGLDRDEYGANGDRGVHRAVVDLDRIAGRSPQNALGCDLEGRSATVVQDDAELVGRVPPDGVTAAQNAGRALRDFGQDRVADIEPERLVDLLQIVDRDHEEAGRRLLAGRPRKHGCECVGQPAAT